MFGFLKVGCKEMKEKPNIGFLQVNRYLENTYVLSSCAYHSHNVSKF